MPPLQRQIGLFQTTAAVFLHWIVKGVVFRKDTPIMCSKVCILLVPCRQHETVIPGELPLVQELTNTLREWAVIWRKLYVVSFPWGSPGGGLGAISGCSV